MTSLSDPRPAMLAEEPAPALVEQRESGGPVYQGRLLKVWRDEVLTPDGHQAIREYTLHPGAAAIIPVFDNGDLLLERQWRYPLNRSFVEFPAGKLDPGETPLQTAVRELREETGYSAARWAYLGPMHPVISYSTEVIHIFLAEGLTEGLAACEAGEVIDLIRMSRRDFFAAAQSGEVSDAKTLAAAFWLQRLDLGEFVPQFVSSDGDVHAVHAAPSQDSL